MRWVVIGVAAMLVGLLSYGVAQQDAESAATASLRVGVAPPSPDTKLPVLGEEAEGSVADYKGQVVLVNYWASWCPPCKDELPLLERTHKTMARSGATVLGINALENTEDAIGAVEEYGLTFPSLRDGDGDYADEWGVAQYPETFLLDREGKVAALVQGPVTQRFIDEQVLPLVRRS